jgi:protein-disulfide isomerase
MKMKWESALTMTLVVCALVTTGLVVRREFFTPLASARSLEQKPVFIENWSSHLKDGVQLGLSGAPVQLVEFADFECPHCATFDRTLKTLRGRYPTKIALYYVHFPLSGHRFAEAAARAAECAGAQGRFEEMHDRLFEQQNAFGLKPWSEYAIEAGVSDHAAFEACVTSTAPIPRIESGREFGTKLDIKGTPTLIINGWQLAQPPTSGELEGMVKAVLSGKSPISAH